MSRYIQILNSIKANINRLPLTPSQIACRTSIEERLAYPGVVNLYGLPGVGKTVLAWVMASSENMAYVVHPNRWVQQNLQLTQIVFVDNAEADRTNFRRLLGVLELVGVERAVVVTRTPADDYVFRTELGFTDDDIIAVRHNLAELGYQASEQEYPDLWHLLLQIVRKGL